MRKIIYTLLFTLTLLSLGACAGRERGPGFADEYLRALQEVHSNPVDPELAVASFESVFHNLRADGLRPHVEHAYAEHVFFNDTLHTFRDRETLYAYLARTGERLDDMQVGILGWSIEGNDVMVRWMMRTEYSIGRRQHNVTTVGMTHLRFDEHGRITLHQDFWDSGQGLYEHVPVLGGLVRWIRGRL